MARMDPLVRVETQETKVAIPVSCKPDIGPDPVYPDGDTELKAMPNIFERVKLLLAGRLMRMHRENELKAALKACMEQPTAAASRGTAEGS